MPSTESEIVRLARADAIQAYASIETSLCMLMAHLLNTNNNIAGIIFYRIVNTRSRLAILSDLMKTKYGDSYKTFWNSVVKILRGDIDPRRNEIVHFHVGQHIHVEEESRIIETYLVPQNYWRSRDDFLRLCDLVEFNNKCDVISRMLNIFTVFQMGHMPPSGAGAWHDIFQRPLLYPLPDTHPLSPNYEEQKSPPPPSEA